MMHHENCSRRQFLGALGLGLLAENLPAEAKDKPQLLRDEIGVTASSFSGHLVAKPRPGQFSLLDLPRTMRNELGMRVIDLNTSVLASMDRRYLGRVRNAAVKAGCILTNLKMNQRNLDMSSNNPAARKQALAVYQRSIDAAAALGCRWARPLPTAKLQSMTHYVASYRQLADYAARRHIQMLIENFGWMDADPNSVPRLAKAVGRRVAVCPDTGNWQSNRIRYQGLALCFPLAVTCDFKARALGPKGEHKLYDLQRCCQIGRKAGFHGPWCLEHANRNRKTLFRELVMLRDMLQRWIRQ